MTGSPVDPALGELADAIVSVAAQVGKHLGEGGIRRLGDQGPAPVEVIPTGSIALDVALGIGGLPRGRVIELCGPETSGKTTVALHAVANAQRAGGIAAFIDAGHALDPDYAKELGVDTDALLVSQPETGEQTLEIMDMLIRSGAIDLIVIDSVAALVPKAEIEGEMGDSHVGLQARLMSQALRKITGALNASGTTAIFINQLRERNGLFGTPETMTGGKALKFYASVRIEVRRIETLKEGSDPVGNRTRAQIVKNKLAPPFKQAEFDIIYGRGISREGGLIDLGVEHGLIRKSGAWYTYEGDQLGQGKENARGFLRDNPDLADELERMIRDRVLGFRVEASDRRTSATRRRATGGMHVSGEVNAPSLLATADLGPYYSETAISVAFHGRSISDLVEEGVVLGLPTDEGPLLFPGFQFGDGPGDPLPGLPAVSRLLREAGWSPLTQAKWLVSPRSSLDSKPPFEVLAQGGSQAVMREAASDVLWRRS